MPRFYRGLRGMRRRRRPRAISNTFKNQRSETSTYAGLGANNAYTVATGTPVVGAATQPDVPVGSVIKAITVNISYINSSSTANTSWSWMLVKFRKGQSLNNEFGATNASNWSSIGLSNARNQVIMSDMGVAGTEDSAPILRNRTIPIPPIYRRMREGDFWQIVFNADEGGTLAIGSRYKVHY